MLSDFPQYLAEELESLQKLANEDHWIPKGPLASFSRFCRRDLATAREVGTIKYNTRHPLYSSVSLDYNHTYTSTKFT